MATYTLGPINHPATSNLPPSSVIASPVGSTYNGTICNSTLIGTALGGLSNPLAAAGSIIGMVSENAGMTQCQDQPGFIGNSYTYDQTGYTTTGSYDDSTNTFTVTAIPN